MPVLPVFGVGREGGRVSSNGWRAQFIRPGFDINNWYIRPKQ